MKHKRSRNMTSTIGIRFGEMFSCAATCFTATTYLLRTQPLRGDGAEARPARPSHERSLAPRALRRDPPQHVDPDRVHRERESLHAVLEEEEDDEEDDRDEEPHRRVHERLVNAD